MDISMQGHGKVENEWDPLISQDPGEFPVVLQAVDVSQERHTKVVLRLFVYDPNVFFGIVRFGPRRLNPACLLPHPQVSICLECNSSKLRGLKRKWIRCSAQATVLHLKKFIAKKLNLTSFNEVNAATAPPPK